MHRLALCLPILRHSRPLVGLWQLLSLVHPIVAADVHSVPNYPWFPSSTEVYSRPVRAGRELGVSRERGAQARCRKPSVMYTTGVPGQTEQSRNLWADKKSHILG